MIKPFEAIAVFYKDEEGYFQAFSPNVEGAISYGETLDEARANIKEAVEGVIKTALDKDIVNYFQHDEYRANEGEIVERPATAANDATKRYPSQKKLRNKTKFASNRSIEVVKIDRKLQVAVSIKIARERSGYSQQDVGKRLGMTQQSISRYEKGIVVPSADKFLELLEA